MKSRDAGWSGRAASFAGIVVVVAGRRRIRRGERVSHACQGPGQIVDPLRLSQELIGFNTLIAPEIVADALRGPVRVLDASRPIDAIVGVGAIPIFVSSGTWGMGTPACAD